MNNESPFIIIKNHRKRQPLAEISFFDAPQHNVNTFHFEKTIQFYPSPMKDYHDKENYDLLLDGEESMKKLPSPHHHHLINYS